MPVASPRAPNDVLTKLGLAIIRARKEHGLSQEALAHEASIDRSYMSSVERGKQNVGVIHLARIAYALGMTVTDLVADANL